MKNKPLFELPKRQRVDRVAEYPPEWEAGEIQKWVREAADHRCEECGMEFRNGTNIAVSEVNRDGKPVIGTVHHIDHDKMNCEPHNLVYLCQRCHCHVQWRWQPGDFLPRKWRYGAPEWVVKRGLPYKPFPMDELF